jgi:uncharacterized protein (TIGR02391 family)
MPSRPYEIPSEPPTLSADKAIALIGRQLERLSDIERLQYDDAKVDAWESTTRDILDKTFGRPQGDPHQKTDEAMKAWAPPMRYGGSTPAELQDDHRILSVKRRAILEAYVEQLKDGLTPPVLATPNYRLHPEIESVSGELLRDGHYKQAALEAYICVINKVKYHSGLDMEGDQLVNHAFGCDGGRQPVLAFNSLGTDAEHDEQRGIMYLFKGIVGLRNAKAHSNVLFNDQSRAHEYLALASLLMRLLEIASVVR